MKTRRCFNLTLILIISFSTTFTLLNAQANNETTASIPSTTTSTTTTTTTTTAVNTTTKSAVEAKTCECLNGGSCVTTDSSMTCKCTSGYYGARCELALCKPNASKDDSLVERQCVNGYCLRDTVTSEYGCKCKPSHTGALCERPVCLDYCYNGGACTDGLGTVYDFELDKLDTFVTNMTCLCPLGNRYYGARCEFDKCVEVADTCASANKCWLDEKCKCNCEAACDQTYCNKLGTCAVNSDGKLSCQCSIGYSGIRCSRDECVGFCFFNGTCNRNNQTIYCDCAPGYNGTRCENRFFKQAATSTYQPQKQSSSSMKSLIYGLTITIIICLCLIGVYLLLQNGTFDHLNISILNRIRGYRTGSQSASSTPGTHNGPSIVRTNLFFNKLEDEQNIIQNMS